MRLEVFTVAHHKQIERIAIQMVRDGRLCIDDDGRVWRVKYRGKPIERKRAECVSTHGYLAIGVYANGAQTTVLASRLVWQHFFGDIPNGLCINHKNGVKADNRPENLEVVTYSENSKHAFAMGLHCVSGARGTIAALTAEEVREAREMYATGNHRMVDVARQYGVTKGAMSKIIRGESYVNEGGPISTSNWKPNPYRDPVRHTFLPGPPGRNRCQR